MTVVGSYLIRIPDYLNIREAGQYDVIHNESAVSRDGSSKDRSYDLVVGKWRLEDGVLRLEREMPNGSKRDGETAIFYEPTLFAALDKGGENLIVASRDAKDRWLASDRAVPLAEWIVTRAYRAKWPLVTKTLRPFPLISLPKEEKK